MGKKFLVYNDQLWELSQKFEYTGSLQEFTLQPDTYLFVANGARGGRQPDDGKNRNTFISWGGTTYGILDLNHTQTFYAAVGGEGGNSQGSTVKTVGGYNGGGSGGASATTGTINGAGGGGATDVRLSNVENTYEEEPVYAPHGYDQLEFLSSWVGDPCGYVQDGNYIDTGYLIKSNSKIELVIEVDPEDETGTGRIYAGPIFGAGSTGRYFPQSVSTGVIDQNGSGVYFFEDNTQYSAYIDMNKYEWGTPEWVHAADNRYIHGFGKIKFTLDGNTLRYESEDGTIDYTLYPETRVNCEFPMYIFSVDVGGKPVEQGSGMYSGWPELAQMRFYYMKIWEGDQLVHWYVPIALATDDGHISVLPYESTFTEEQRRIMRNRGIFDLVDRKPYFGVLKESTNIPNPYYGIGPHRDPVDCDYYSTRMVQKINGASSRILVAGGGGGSSVMHDTNNTPDFYSFGGGFLAGCISGPSVDISNYATLRATQESGYSFGAGADADDRSGTASSGVSYGNTGNGGGGGGWYGGYAIASGSSTSAYSGGYGGSGGSSYILTESSYKPTGYMDGYTDIMPSLYFRDGLMLPYQAFEGASLEIYKLATMKPLVGDKIIAPLVGTWQHVELLPARYKIKCYGGDGGTRLYNSVASKGGYAEGILNLPDARSLFLHVGSSSYIYATDATKLERRQMFTDAMWFQNKSLATISTVEVELMATQPGGSTDVRIEQTGYVEKDISVPEGYDQIEYLICDGTQHIQTTWFVNNEYEEFEFICDLTDTGKRQALFGASAWTLPSTGSQLGIFPVYDVSNPQLTLDNKVLTSNGSQMPFGQKVRIKITGNKLVWFDDQGNQLGEITSTQSRQGQMGYYYYLFDFNNSSSVMGAKIAGKIYQFTVVEVKSTGSTIKHWCLPCVSKTDPNDVCLFDCVSQTFLRRYNTSTMNPFGAGPVVQKTPIRVVIYNETISRYSRFIVAGGGGGQGSPIGFGGDGGGIEGEMCKGTATDSYVPGVGRQNGGAIFGNVSGGGRYNNVSYLGTGGNGWYSGYSARNGTGSNPAASENDVNKGGSGGSSYVLTADSYKPTYTGWTYDERFYLSDTVLTTGGNPVRGMTKIEIEVLDSSATNLSVLAGDGEFYKAYDTSMNVWSPLIDIHTLTPEVFEEYGVSLEEIISDEGLTFPYKLYLYDPYHSGATKIWTYVVPVTQHVSFTESCSIRGVKNYTLDDELDEQVHSSIQYTNTGSGISTDISLTMDDVPTKESHVYMVQYRVEKQSTTKFEPQPLEKSGDEIVLYSTSTNNKITSACKYYPSSTSITSVDSSSSCEYRRKIYTISVINNETFRITEYDMATDTFSIIREDIAKSKLSGSGATGGSVLVKNNTLYLFNSFLLGSSLAPGDLMVMIVPLNPTGTVVVRRSRDMEEAGLSYRSTCYGQSYWYSETEIISCAVNGFFILDTETNNWTYHGDIVHIDDTPGTSFAIGKYTIMKCIYDENGTTEVHVFDRETLIGVSGYTVTFPNGKRCVCYNDGYFYVAQPGYLYILQDQSNCKPSLSTSVNIPDNSLQPKTIDCTNGCIYITFENSDSIYVYSLTLQKWLVDELPFTVPTSNTTGWYRPAVFGGYFFIGNMDMYTANANLGGKYSAGERNSYVHIFPNESYANNMTYDDRFITPDKDGLSIHMGYIDKTLTPISQGSDIYQTQDYTTNDYNRMMYHRFNKGD